MYFAYLVWKNKYAKYTWRNGAVQLDKSFYCTQMIICETQGLLRWPEVSQFISFVTPWELTQKWGETSKADMLQSE